MVKARVRSAGDSDPGRVRKNNEDSLHLDPDRGIYLVVDGIGGQAAGEKAAAIAVERLRARLERQTGTAEQRIREAITVANNEILRASRSNPEWEGMACVLTVAVLENGSAVVGHVGDSRLYQIRGGEIRKVTHDHSPVGEREDSREISEAEAMRHPRRNEVFRDVGSEEHTPDDPEWIEVQRIPFEADSALLLCSDGLSDMVPSAEIRAAVERNAGKPEAAVRELISAANRAGGKDNVTVVLVEGEQFTAPAPVAKLMPVRKGGASRWAFLACGLLLGLGGMYAALRWGLGWTVPAPPVPPPQVIQVGPGLAITRISDALQQARPGDTVEVLAGDYHEQLRVKNGVSVESRVPREAVLLPVAGNDQPLVIADNAKDATVSGFLIRGDPQAPLSAGIVLNDSDVHIVNMEVTGAGIGILVHGGSPVLLGNSVYDCTAGGIVVAGPAKPWILHNSIRRTRGPGLAVRDGAQPAVAENVFERNAPDLEMPAEALRTVKPQNVFVGAPRPAAPHGGQPAPRPAQAPPHQGQAAPRGGEAPQPREAEADAA
jgi:serine/threonine protein phosphatase PrpC